MSYVVQGVPGATGPVTASSPLFLGGTGPVEIDQPVFQLLRLDTSQTTLQADNPFSVRTGLVRAFNPGLLLPVQNVSAAAGPLTVTLTSSDLGVGQPVTTAVSGVRVEAQMAVNTSRSPTTVAAGGVAFRPIGAGTATVFAEAPGFDAAFPVASVEVTVSP